MTLFDIAAADVRIAGQVDTRRYAAVVILVGNHRGPAIHPVSDLRELGLALFMRHSIRIDVATQGNPTGAEYDLFETNAFVLRAEVPVGVGVLRPQAFAVIALPGGS